MLRSGEMGSLSAGPGSPTASTDKALRQGELAPAASGARSRTRIAEPQAVLPLTDAGLQPGRRNLGPGASSGGAAGTKAPHRAEHYSDLSICQAKPEKTSWPVPSLEPDKIPPELQPDIPEASAEFHSLWIRSLAHTHQEPSRTALCQGIPLQGGPRLLFRLPCMRQSEECSPRSRESPAAANSTIPAAGCSEAGASIPRSLP